jgi:hypothetical protein
MVQLLEEQNQLLRELHLKLTGHHALTPKRTVSQVPPRIRTGADVWTSQPLTEARQDALAREQRERAASPPGSAPSSRPETNLPDQPLPTS